jgi:hypothetical protein
MLFELLLVTRRTLVSASIKAKPRTAIVAAGLSRKLRKNESGWYELARLMSRKSSSSFFRCNCGEKKHCLELAWLCSAQAGCAAATLSLKERFARLFVA